MNTKLEIKTFFITISVIVVLAATFTIGAFYGSHNVLQAERLKAQHEVTHVVVRVSDKPDPTVVELAKDSCRSNARYNECVQDFIEPFAPTYIVNVLSGNYTRIETPSGGTE